MDWCSIDEGYLNYLRAEEGRIPESDYGTDKFKPFFGVLFSIGDYDYVTQVSHPKERHRFLTQNKDFIKLYNRSADGRQTNLMAVVNLNYMFPVKRENITIVTAANLNSFKTFNTTQALSDYWNLLQKEMVEIIDRDVAQKANDLYNFKYSNPTSPISLRCFDFKSLEVICENYSR